MPLLDRVRRRLPASALLRDTGVAFADQVVVSLAAFAVGVLVIRSTSAADYGLFVLANAALFLAAALQNSLIGLPMAIFAPKLAAAERTRFFGAIGLTQLAVWVPLTGLGAILLWSATALEWIAAATQPMAWATLAVAPTVVLREFFRQGFYALNRPALTLAFDVVQSGAMLLGVGLAVANTAGTPSLAAVVAIGASGLLSGFWGVWLFRRLPGSAFSVDFALLTRFWQPARWSVLSMLVSWVQNQGFLYVLGALAGREAVAGVAAARLLLMPIAALITSINSILRPRCAAWIAAGQGRKARDGVLGVTAVVATVALLYTAAVWAAIDLLLVYVLGTPIAGIEILIPLWGIAFLVQVFRFNLMLLLQVLERFRSLFYASVVGAVGALLAGYLGIQALGAPGSVAGVAVGDAIYAAVLIALVARESRRGSLR